MNHAPLPQPQTVLSNATATTPAATTATNHTLITLRSERIDDTFSPNPWYVVERAPSRGSLYQYEEQSMFRRHTQHALNQTHSSDVRSVLCYVEGIGARIEVGRASAPVYGYVQEVVGISTQFSFCPECVSNLTCTGGCQATGTSWMAQNVVGKEDVYPAYGLAAGGWLPSSFSNPLEFLELKFEVKCETALLFMSVGCSRRSRVLAVGFYLISFQCSFPLLRFMRHITRYVASVFLVCCFIVTLAFTDRFFVS